MFIHLVLVPQLPAVDGVLEPGDISTLARPLGQGSGTHSPKALWGGGIDVLRFGEQQGALSLQS